MTPVGSSVQYTCDETSVTVQLISGVSDRPFGVGAD